MQSVLHTDPAHEHLTHFTLHNYSLIMLIMLTKYLYLIVKKNYMNKYIFIEPKSAHCSFLKFIKIVI